MTPRERVLAALEHRQPDRVPMDLGSARFSGITQPAYADLCRHLGFGAEGAIIDQMQQLAEIDDRILRHFDVDLRPVVMGPPDKGGDVQLPPGRFRDEWGVERVRPPGCPFYELRQSPLEGQITPSDIASYPWPDPADPGRVRGLRERARKLREETDYALVFNARYHAVHQTQYMRGFMDWYCDFGQNHSLFRCLMDAVVENMIETNKRALKEVGDLVDVVAFGDDLGLQDRPMCSLASYRALIRPYQERIMDSIRAHTQAKVLYHTCGSVYAFIEDFIDLGIHAINPVQVSARHMEPERLKKEFGGRIAFWGGIDTQRILPHGTPDAVREEVRRIFELLGPGGGYVLASVHNVQPDVPAANLCAMFEAGATCRYPNG